MNYDLRFTSDDLRITSDELRFTKYDLRVANYELRSANAIMNYGLRGTVQGSADFADFSGVETCVRYYVCMVILITTYRGDVRYRSSMD